MSHGPSRLARIMKELFANNPDLAFAVPDLVDHITAPRPRPRPRKSIASLCCAQHHRDGSRLERRGMPRARRCNRVFQSSQRTKAERSLS